MLSGMLSTVFASEVKKKKSRNEYMALFSKTMIKKNHNFIIIQEIEQYFHN